MKTPKMIFLAWSTSVFVACASTHPGWFAQQAQTEKPRNLAVSVDIDNDLSDEGNAFYDFTIENKELSWLRIESAEVTFSDTDKIITNIIVGQDLVAWGDSENQKAKISEHNINMATTAAVVAGAALAVASGKGGNTGLARTGAVIAATGAGVQIGRDIKRSVKAAEQSAAVPENHILHGPFTVPSQGLAKRWILLGFPQKERPVFGNLILKTVEGEKLTYAFYLKRPTVR
jgi:hypothetical protein